MDSSTPDSKENPEQKPPRGAVLHAQFTGILEGFAGDWSTLEDTVAKINATKIAIVDLEMDGGRFSLLFENTPIPGELVTPEAQQQLLELLATLIAATHPGPRGRRIYGRMQGGTRGWHRRNDTGCRRRRASSPQPDPRPPEA